MNTDHHQEGATPEEESSKVIPWLEISKPPALGSPEMQAILDDLAQRIFKDRSRSKRIAINPFDFRELKKGSFSLTKFYMDKVSYGLKGQDVVSANGLAFVGPAVTLDVLLERHDEFVKELEAMKKAEEKLKVLLRELGIDSSAMEVRLTARAPELEMEESFTFRDVEFIVDHSQGETEIVSARYKRKVITKGFPVLLTKDHVVQIAATAVKEYAKV